MIVSEPHGPGSELRRGSLTRWRRRLTAGVAALLAFYFAVNFVDVWLASRADYEPVGLRPDMARAAIVLGAAQYNGEPSPVLRGRLDEAAELFEAGQVDLVVVTGGGQEADITTEAKSGYDYLRQRSNIPDEQLRLEVQGSSTYESLAASARFLRREGVEEVVLVTDRFHAKRSILVAREVGLDPVVSLTSPGPSLHRLVRETAAVSVGRIVSFRRLQQLS